MKNRVVHLLLATLVAVAGCAAAPTPAPVVPPVASAPAAAPEAAPPPAASPGTTPVPHATPAAAAPAAPAEPAPEPAVLKAPPPAPAAAEKYISLNFDNADVAVVIQTISELLHLNYLVAPGVRGRVTIQTSEKLPVSSLFAVLEQILEINQLTAVKSGDFYKILPAAQAKQEALETLTPEAAEAAGGRFVTRIVPLKFISPTEVIKVITPFKSAAGLYQGHDPSRLLFLTETANKIPELMKIVEILDVDTFASIQVDLYPVRYANVEDLAKELTQIVSMIFTASGRGRSLFRIVPVTSVNSLMVFSAEPGLAANLRDWVTKLDQPATEANERIFVYPLSHAKAEDLAGILEKIFSKDKKQGQVRPATTTPTPRTAAPSPVAPGTPGVPTPVVPQQPVAPTPVSAAAAGAGASVSGTAASPVTIVADKATNSLIIQTAAWYYPVVEATIRKLDVMPKQVLIEVLIAEISLDDGNQFGIQWALKGQGQATVGGEAHGFNTGAQNLYDKALGLSSPGFSLLVTEANRVTAALRAYAKDTRLNILSAPHILAADNKEAKIDVGAEVPILKTRTTATTGSTSTTDTITNDIEYRSTGIILTVTPHINEGGFVTLDVQQEVSEAQTNTLGGTDSPIIRKRTAKTTMVVKDDQTLVIGGLIEEKWDRAREGIPLLSKIPILGYLFGTTSAKVSKTELVLLITPRVIADVEEGRSLTEEVTGRSTTLKKGIEGFRNNDR